MTPTSQPLRVVAVIDPGPVQEQIGAALGAQAEFRLVDVLSAPETLIRDLHLAQPELLVVGHQVAGQPTLDLIDDLGAQFPGVPVVALLPDEDPVRLQQAMLAGARAFLVQPFTQVNLLSTLRRVRELESRRGAGQAEATTSESAGPLRTLAVFSPRGGSGVSTLASNLAIALLEASGGRVLLFEGKLFFGHLDVLLNLRTRNTLADLLPHAANLDENLLREVVAPHASGIDVLLGPPDVQVAQGVRPQDLYNVLRLVQLHYDYVVIDAGSLLNENTVTLLDAAERILLVTNPDLASLHDASRFLQVSQTLAYPPSKIGLVLNRAGLPGGVRLNDIESALRQKVSAQVPDDSANALRSLNRGVPLLLKYPRSPASRGIQALARQLLAQGAAQARPGGAPVTARGKKKRLAGSQVA